ncbi:FADD protein, partial [Erythrocercus mccallii]|nr:FADD protein [Erythrocercus mccallii]
LDPLRSLLHSISSRLSDKELADMKFLCRDKIGKGKLSAVQSGQDLFNILIEQQEITRDNLELLKKLLQHIKRQDLLSEVVQFEEGQFHAPDEQPDEHEKPVAVILGHVGREWKRLMRELGMPEVNLDRIEAAYPFKLYEQLVLALREWQKWKGKDAKVGDLIQALRGCNLNLVADKVEE